MLLGHQLEPFVIHSNSETHARLSFGPRNVMLVIPEQNLRLNFSNKRTAQSYMLSLRLSSRQIQAVNNHRHVIDLAEKTGSGKHDSLTNRF